MTVERLARIGVLIGLLTLAVVTVSLFAGLQALVGPNGKILFLILIGAWVAGMTFLASLGLSGLTIGGIALVMLFIGFFVFMGFIWAVIGE